MRMRKSNCILVLADPNILKAGGNESKLRAIAVRDQLAPRHCQRWISWLKASRHASPAGWCVISSASAPFPYLLIYLKIPCRCRHRLFYTLILHVSVRPVFCSSDGCSINRSNNRWTDLTSDRMTDPTTDRSNDRPTEQSINWPNHGSIDTL